MRCDNKLRVVCDTILRKRRCGWAADSLRRRRWSSKIVDYVLAVPVYSYRPPHIIEIPEGRIDVLWEVSMKVRCEHLIQPAGTAALGSSFPEAALPRRGKCGAQIPKIIRGTHHFRKRSLHFRSGQLTSAHSLLENNPPRKTPVMAAIGSLVFCVDCGNLLEPNTSRKAYIACDLCGTQNKGLIAHVFELDSTRGY